MLVTVFKQVYEPVQAEIDLTPAEIEFGFAQIPCSDCNGIGRFGLPDDTEEMCICCKGTGLLWVTL